MKKLLFWAANLFLVGQILAQNPVVAKANIESARVYMNAAELKHKTSVQIPAGTSELIITNVAESLNENSITIKAPSYVTVMSAQFTTAYIQETSNLSSNEQSAVRTEIQNKQKELEKIQFNIATEEKGLELLDGNRNINNSATFSVPELKQWFAYYKTARLETLNKISALKDSEKQLNETIKQLNGKLQLNEANNSSYSQGKLVVNVSSTKAGQVPLEITYLTHNASWTPNYELNIAKINQPIQFYYQAQVRQNTGVDWKNTKLSLISAPANQSTQAPELNTWFINYEQPLIGRPANMAIASARVKNSEKADFDRGEIIAKEALYTSSVSDYTAMSQSQLSVTYDIAIPYTILSNNKNHLIKLKETAVPATYDYVAIPKLDQSVYLVAKIKDYGAYDILPGKATIILEDIFVGQTFLSPDANSADLSLSIGKDPNILISRKKIDEKSQSKTLSSKKVQDFVYEISIRNNKKETVQIEVEDNYPISTNTDIEVALLDKDGATVNAETGKLTWHVTVKPNETKKIKFGYQVKFAKDKTIRL
ncbi:DUF4139 domain-containing protein [Flavobacterium agricola]|uniref:DUF4139 domain-containing protein n=1 Tax=Flavobacterium agricola TaxID=2870839 RepID=A0ABY6LXU6_9FLAO|nr:DUF4139 domain-containing protein [Flavobacterium agricola]UYW01158.1 DUF4139 domain-containing protein [Flavobacterium agricola]